jgi:hypothetical protein
MMQWFARFEELILILRQSLILDYFHYALSRYEKADMDKPQFKVAEEN